MAFLDIARKKAEEDKKKGVFYTGTTVNLSNKKNTASNTKTSETTSSAKSKSTKTTSNTSSNNSSTKKISTYPILKGNLPPNKGKTPILDSAFKAAAEERKKYESRTTYGSAPKSTALTDFNTQTKNAYTSAKNKASTKTTMTSNLSEKERKARIKEIEAEMRSLNNTIEGSGRAKSYSAKKYHESLDNTIEEAKKRKAELSEELKKLKRVGTFTASELKQFEIDDAKAKKAALPNYNPTARIMPSQADAFKANIQAHNELDKEIDRLEREKELYDDITEFGDAVHSENGNWFNDFNSQWRANYRSNELSREADKAMSEYDKNPTEENRQIAYAYDAFEKAYKKNNEKALDDENVVASWLTKTTAGYLPQLKDQIVPELVGGGIGYLLGGNVGASIGAGIGTYAQSYDVIRGSVYRTLLAEGVDEETAKKAAEDEALISSLIESGETAVSWLISGGGKALKAIGTAAKTSVAKGSTNAATKFVASIAGKATDRAASKAAKAAARPLWNKALRVAGGVVGNALTEYGEEFSQGAVSIANREQAYATVEKDIGQFGRGNIDLYDRPIYKNADGSISTVDSVTFQIDGKYVVLPTIARDEKGNAIRLETDEEILAHYAETGEYLGEFDTLEESNAYATKLHTAQAYYYDNKFVSADDNLWSGGAKVVKGALSGDNPDTFAELHEQGKEGFKIGLMMGGSQTIANNAISQYANAKTVKMQNEIADTIIEDEESLKALIEEGKASGAGTVSSKIAEEIETAKASGKEVTRTQVKQLIESNEVYIKAEEQTTAPATLEQAAIDVVNERNQTNTPTYERLEALSRSNEPIAVEEVKKASGFGDNGAKLLTEIASQDGMTFVKARDEMKVAYLSGYNGEHTTFTSNLQNRAKLAGVDDRIADNNIAIENAKNSTVYKGAFTENEHTKNWSKATKKMVATVAKHFGMDIASVDRIIANELTGAEANASHNDGKMRISNNRTAEKLIHALVIHESGHRMEQFATNEWNELSNFLYNRAERLGRRAELGFNRGMAFDAIKAQHDNAGISMSTRDYIGEIAVRELETIFSSAEEFNSFIAEIESNQQAKSGFQKIVDFILELIEDVKRLIAETKMSKEERAEARKELAELERIKELYAKAYIATRNAVAERANAQANQSAKIQKNTNTEGSNVESKINFDLREDAEAEVTKVLNGTNTESEIKLTDSSPAIMLGHRGVKNLPMTMIASHIRENILTEAEAKAKGLKVNKNINYHGLGKELFLKVIAGLDNVTEAYRGTPKAKDSNRRENYFLLISQYTDGEENIINVPVFINEKGLYNRAFIDTNKIATVFGREQLRDYITRQIQAGNLVRIKKRSPQTSESASPINAHYGNGTSTAEQSGTSDTSSANDRIPQNPKSVKSDFSLKEKETNMENTSQFSLKASNNGIYDYTKSFAQQVDDWKNGLIPQNDSLLVGATPKVFKKIGFNPLPFTINQRHIDYAINGTKDIDHSLGETLLAQLPQALENPLAIISSQTQPDRVVAILKIQHKGKNIVAPVEIDGYGTQNNVSIDSNAITSVFGKGNAITKLLTDALNSEAKGSISVFYWNKKEALSLLQTPGLQLPSHLPQDGFIHSITENGSPVKQRLKNITESQQFKRWFGNSKVVNKDGTPKIVYHGTSKGGHTVFDAWGKGKFGLFGIGIYMTESREVAEGYTKKGKGITPQVYELYANITNPLDMDKTANVKKWKKQTSGEIDFSNCTTNEDCFRAVKEYCEDEQMVRWEAEEYITEIIRDMGYDGITHIGGGRYNKQDATRHRVWIAFDSTQIKSATDNIGTFDNNNPDIRYSLKEIDNISTKDREQLLDIIEHLKGEFEITKFPKADPKKLAAMTKKLLKEYDSIADVDETIASINELYHYIANGEDGHPPVWDEVYSKAYDIADEIVENAVVTDDTLYKEYKSLRAYLRSVGMTFHEGFDDVPSGYDSFNQFRKANFGRFNFVKNGMGIDSVYKELASLYPEFFNEEENNNTGDQLNSMVEVLDSLKPIDINPHEQYLNEAATYLANDIIERFFDIPQAKPTFADKAERRLLNQKIKDANKLERVREQNRDRIEKLKASQKEKTKKLIEKAKESKAKAISKEKQKRRDAISKMGENQKAKVLRAQILRHTNELSKKLIKPTDNQHIPHELQGAVAKLLECINLESNYVIDPVSKRREFKKDYSYDALTSKPDIEVAQIDIKDIYNTEGKIDRYNIIKKGIENVRAKKNPKNTDVNAFVYIPDIGRNVLVTKDSLRHGLTRNAEATAIVTQHIGDVLENSIVINELNPRESSIGGYVLLGVAVDIDNNYYPVRAVVNNYEVDKIEVLDVLYALNAKKRRTSPQMRQGIVENSTPLIKGSSNISIAELLEIVKNDFSDVMTDDVLLKLNVERKESSLSRSLKYTYDLERVKRERVWLELKEQYEALNNDETRELVIDPELAENLKEIVKLRGKSLYNMTSSELETVWQAIRAIEASVSTANRVFSEGKYATILGFAEALREDNKGKTSKTEYEGFKGDVKKLTGLDMLTPETYFHYLGNAGDSIFRMMRNAQDKHISIMNEVADFTHKTLKDVDVNSLEKTLHTVRLGEEDVKLSTAQLMELYVLMKREQAKEHVLGGILPDDIKTKGTKKITRAEPVRDVSVAEIATALSKLTKEQKAIADKLQKFMSTTLSQYGNEASMKVYNYEKFLEKNYWPIRTNKQEISSDTSKDTAVSTVANKGMTKATTPHANQSVHIGSIFDTFAQHSSDMATYAAWLGTTEDVNRIRNFVFWEEVEKKEGEKKGKRKRTGTVKGIIDTVHGKHGSEYLQKLLTDISIGVKGTDNMTLFDKLTGSYKAASVGANIRVIVQQPTAVLRALDMIDARYLAEGVKHPLKGWEKAKKYAPIAQWKDWGYFDINTGRQMKDVLFNIASKLEKAKQVGMWGASMADSLAWGQLWNAVEAETRHKHKEFEVGTEEYYKTVAKRFTEIVDHTQVVDGILQRSQIMRSPDRLSKMTTSFMGEPTKQYNMAVSAVYDAKNLKGDAQKKTVVKLGRAAIALAVAGIVNACAQSFIDAMRDDDKEKDYWEKWLAAFGGNALDVVNPLNYVPLAKDIMSIMQGYDVKRMDTEAITKTFNATKNMYKAVTGTGKYTIAEASAALFAEIARLVGLPVSNVKRDIKSLVMTVAIESENYLMQYRMEKAMLNINYSDNEKNFADILYNAYVNDKEAYKIIYNDMIESGYDSETISKKMEARMKKAEGVKEVSELTKRYMAPAVEKKYDSSLKQIKSNEVWQSATTEQRQDAKADLYDFLTSTDKNFIKTREEAKAFGVDETEYTLWQLAIEMADQPKGQKGSGSYDYKEKAEAINSLNLGDREIAYFFGKGLNESSKEELNETLNAGIDIQEYVNFKAATSEMKADKNANGKSIPNSKKRKVVNYLNNANLTDEEWAYFYYEIMNYKK